MNGIVVPAEEFRVAPARAFSKCPAADFDDRWKNFDCYFCPVRRGPERRYQSGAAIQFCECVLISLETKLAIVCRNS